MPGMARELRGAETGLPFLLTFCESTTLPLAVRLHAGAPAAGANEAHGAVFTAPSRSAENVVDNLTVDVGEAHVAPAEAEG